jgi:hypothetical protein
MCDRPACRYTLGHRLVPLSYLDEWLISLSYLACLWFKAHVELTLKSAGILFFVMLHEQIEGDLCNSQG